MHGRLIHDLGEYQDRRDLRQVDCSKTVWILATNALDATIQSFCKVHQKPIFEDEDETEKLRLMKTLTKSIKQEFLSHFGVSLILFLPSRPRCFFRSAGAKLYYHRPQ